MRFVLGFPRSNAYSSHKRMTEDPQGQCKEYLRKVISTCNIVCCRTHTISAMYMLSQNSAPEEDASPLTIPRRRLLQAAAAVTLLKVAGDISRAITSSLGPTPMTTSVEEGEPITTSLPGGLTATSFIKIASVLDYERNDMCWAAITINIAVKGPAEECEGGKRSPILHAEYSLISKGECLSTISFQHEVIDNDGHSRIVDGKVTDPSSEKLTKAIYEACSTEVKEIQHTGESDPFSAAFSSLHKEGSTTHFTKRHLPEITRFALADAAKRLSDQEPQQVASLAQE